MELFCCLQTGGITLLYLLTVAKSITHGYTLQQMGYCIIYKWGITLLYIYLLSGKIYHRWLHFTTDGTFIIYKRGGGR